MRRASEFRRSYPCASSATGWNTLALKGTWRPPQAKGAHVVDFGIQQDSYKLVDGAFLTPPPPGGVGMTCSVLDQFSYGQVKVTSSQLTITPKDIDGQTQSDNGHSCQVTLNYVP